MARKSSKETNQEIDSSSSTNIDISSELIKSLNKELGSKVAYNLSEDESPTHVKRWISTGSLLLDYILSNKRNGGVPEGRIIEISGPPSCGKSHISYQIARTTQQIGGLVVYIDTENATPVEKLAAMGLDVSKRFVYCDTHCTEEVFSIIESTITKAKSLIGKDIPIVVIWDSVAATSPKAELDGEYEKDTIGLQARVLSKGMRKITGVIGQNNVTLILLNQNRQKIGVFYGDNTTTPGGMAIPYHASIRLKLTGGSKLEDKNGNIIGINVAAQTIKNKVAQPFRKVDFAIEFGKGIVEADSMFDLLREHCEKEGDVVIDDKLYLIEGAGAWKTFKVSDGRNGNTILEKKFNKSAFGDLLKDSEISPYLLDMIESVFTI
jgi:recombination protein RecA